MASFIPLYRHLLLLSNCFLPGSIKIKIKGEKYLTIVKLKNIFQCTHTHAQQFVPSLWEWGSQKTIYFSTSGGTRRFKWNQMSWCLPDLACKLLFLEEVRHIMVPLPLSHAWHDCSFWHFTVQSALAMCFQSAGDVEPATGHACCPLKWCTRRKNINKCLPPSTFKSPLPRSPPAHPLSPKSHSLTCDTLPGRQKTCFWY